MPTDLRLLLAPGTLRAVFQPIVELAGRTVVAHEALCRGPVGSPLERPDALFAAAAEDGRTAELDWAARETALAVALAGGLRSPATLFVNAEPEGLVAPVPGSFDAVRRRAADAGLQVVLEITERALTTRPAELVRAVDRVRGWGWGIAVDDVGAERASLALLPFLAPDVIKLDLRLVQQRTTVEVAEIVNAVRAAAERSGALLLAEGIETERHAELAVSMGAQYGQGYLLGRPADLLDAAPVQTPLVLPGCTAPGGSSSPSAGLGGLPVHRATKPLLIAISKTLERQALGDGEAAVVLGTFQQARYFTTHTAARYTALASSAAFVAALATDLPPEPAPGVRGTHLPLGDPLTSEWDLAVVGPHFAAALVARDLGDTGPDSERRFDYVLTYERSAALGVASALLRRVGEQVGPAPARRPVLPLTPGRAAVPQGEQLDRLMRRAVAATSTGITIADARQPDQPLVFVNAAFEQLSGYPAEEVLGRNCRFLQDPATDPATLALLRGQLRAGRGVATTLLNRRPDGTTWWNALSISPVRSRDGQLTHFIGVQADVTARLAAERQLAHLAHHDALTGLVNRAGFSAALGEVLERGRRFHQLTGLLFLDLDAFKAVNDRYGHAEGDALLVRVAAALRQVARPGDLVARLGGDEFAVVLPDIRVTDRPAAEQVVARVAVRLAEVVSHAGAHGEPLRVSVGTSVHPDDAEDVDGLLRTADLAMYADKLRGRSVR